MPTLLLLIVGLVGLMGYAAARDAWSAADIVTAMQNDSWLLLLIALVGSQILVAVVLRWAKDRWG